MVIGNVMKYVYSLMARTFISPHTFIYIKTNNSFDISLFLVKDVLVILPNKQDSQVS
jgi:hypothetical protein